MLFMCHIQNSKLKEKNFIQVLTVSKIKKKLYSSVSKTRNFTVLEYINIILLYYIYIYTF